jgi:nitric-oxide synthase
VAGMMLEVGGIQYPAAPFGGWYCSIEIVRNILEPNRYNLLQVGANFIAVLNQKCQAEDF